MKYIDTSAFVKYYSGEGSEKGADFIRELIDRTKSGEEKLISSILLIGETVSVFDKWVRLKLLTKQDFFEILSAFLNDTKELVNNGSMVFEEINSFMVISSLDYIVKHGLTVNHSFHLYTALLNKNRIEEFICSDNNLIRAAKLEGLNILNPED